MSLSEAKTVVCGMWPELTTLIHYWLSKSGNKGIKRLLIIKKLKAREPILSVCVAVAIGASTFSFFFFF